MRKLTWVCEECPAVFLLLVDLVVTVWLARIDQQVKTVCQWCLVFWKSVAGDDASASYSNEIHLKDMKLGSIKNDLDFGNRNWRRKWGQNKLTVVTWKHLIKIEVCFGNWQCFMAIIERRCYLWKRKLATYLEIIPNESVAQSTEALCVYP